MRKGFTLIELSIVLIVIGLLAGGILIARSMIETAGISATVIQLQHFDAGVSNFNTKYNYLPGDAPAFGGNGNGVIERFENMGVDVVQGEILNFWNNLDPVQFPGARPYPLTGGLSTSAATANVPLSKIGSNGSFYIASAMSTGGTLGQVADQITPENYYYILSNATINYVDQGGGYLPYSGGTTVQPAVKPITLLSLDKKIDDGIANTGNVISGAPGEISTGAIGSGITKTPLTTCSQGAFYQIQNSTYKCTPTIRIGGQTGDLQ